MSLSSPFVGPRTLHRFLLRLSLSLAAIYAWVFVFQFFFVRQGSVGAALTSVLLTYAVSQVVVVLLTPYTAQKIRYGFRRLLVYAALALAAAFAVLAATFSGYVPDIGWGAGLFALFMGLYRSLYWTPYSVAKASEPSPADPLLELLIAVAPASAGLFLTLGPASPMALLNIAALLTLLSLVPLFFMRDVHEGYSWGYRESFHELFAHARRRMTVQTVLSGAEASALLLLWPLAVFVLLGWSYPLLGIALSATFLLSFVLRRLLHVPLSRMSTPVSVLLSASAWVMRLGVGSAVGVVLVDTYFYTGSHTRGRGIDAHTFEQVADNTTYIDEHTALKEMGLGIGRILMCLFAAVLASALAVPTVFLIVFLASALAAAGSVYLARS